MTVVGLVSDTHLPRFGRALPRALTAGLRSAGVQRIFHCGDMTDVLAIELLEAIAPVDAVAGNNDGDEIVRRFGRKKIVIVEDARIGLIHGDAGSYAAPRNALAAFSGDSVDAVCFGHSHRALNERRGDRLFVNPGSPTDKRMNPRYSYAVLRIEGNAVTADVRYFSDRRTAAEFDTP